MSHGGEVHHTASEFPFLLGLFGVFMLWLRIPCSSSLPCPALILPLWGKASSLWWLRVQLGSQEAEQGGRLAGTKGISSPAPEVDAPGPPGKKRWGNLAISTNASISIFFFFK